MATTAQKNTINAALVTGLGTKDAASLAGVSVPTAAAQRAWITMGKEPDLVDPVTVKLPIAARKALANGQPVQFVI